jgi:hypothetical protein
MLLGNRICLTLLSFGEHTKMLSPYYAPVEKVGVCKECNAFIGYIANIWFHLFPVTETCEGDVKVASPKEVLVGKS